MTHIKRIDEMLGKNSTSNVEYVITKCQVYVAENNYDKG